ncbi:hypothetical protein EV177_009699, partial [Coemansia sp. RSA 1804]
MSHLVVADFSKAGSVDVSDGATTVTLSYQPHTVKSCTCDHCKAINKAAEEAAKKKKEAEEAAKNCQCAT